MAKPIRHLLFIVIDLVIINIALYLALILRFDGSIPPYFLLSFYKYRWLFTLVLLGCFHYFGLYNRLWQYASIGELLSVCYAVSVGTAINISVVFFSMMGVGLPLPRSVFLLWWLLNIFLIGGSRLAWRLFRDRALNLIIAQGGRPVLVVGAGDTGVLVAKELRRHYNGNIRIVGFIDDNPNKQKLMVLGLPVLGDRNSIPEIVKKYNITEIIIAIPSIGGQDLREIVSMVQSSQTRIKILPGVYDLIEEKVTVNHIREVQVEDLLGREPVRLDFEGISGYLTNHVVLVTGAGGSIGSELCRQIMKFAPTRLLLLDVCENNMYDIEMELRGMDPTIEVVPLVKDIRDKKAIDMIFRYYKPHVVFHAAAHKHVPLMEINSEEAVKNNVMGTYNVAQAADRWGVKRFVLISTDKAVNPTSFMGASKRLAEIVIQHLNQTSKTNFVAVRFGNVLASRGSVIPLFKKQIAEGGPVTVTHPDMVRYFMTIPEAVELVIQAGALSQGGEIFVLDMGEPVKILDLAKTLIHLSGFEPMKDIEIIFTGLRPGEKMFEELMTVDEKVDRTVHERIFITKANNNSQESIEPLLLKLTNDSLPNNYNDTLMLIRSFIPEFRSDNAQCNVS